MGTAAAADHSAALCAVGSLSVPGLVLRPRSLGQRVFLRAAGVGGSILGGVRYTKGYRL